MNKVNTLKTWAVMTALSAGLTSQLAVAEGHGAIEVTITNISNNIMFTPILVASHRQAVELFGLGDAASDELVEIAEGGNVGPMTTLLGETEGVVDVQHSEGLLLAGDSVTLVLEGGRHIRRISMASMMLPTNDSFIGLNSVRVPKRGKTATYFSPGYDAGSETNDELCLNIPGPFCGGEGFSEGDPGEGYVHISKGVSGKADLSVAEYDWRNPVAKITVRRVQGDETP